MCGREGRSWGWGGVGRITSCLPPSPFTPSSPHSRIALPFASSPAHVLTSVRFSFSSSSSLTSSCSSTSLSASCSSSSSTSTATSPSVPFAIATFSSSSASGFSAFPPMWRTGCRSHSLLVGSGDMVACLATCLAQCPAERPLTHHGVKISAVSSVSAPTCSQVDAPFEQFWACFWMSKWTFSFSIKGFFAGQPMTTKTPFKVDAGSHPSLSPLIPTSASLILLRSLLSSRLLLLHLLSVAFLAFLSLSIRQKPHPRRAPNVL